jgi:hypothetical protein
VQGCFARRCSMTTTYLIAACAMFYWAGGLKGLEIATSAVVTVPLSLHGAEEAELLGRWRYGVCQTPTYWSYQNRSFGIRHIARTEGSGLLVLNTQSSAKLPVARHDNWYAVGCLLTDRFLVPQLRGRAIDTQPCIRDIARNSTLDNKRPLDTRHVVKQIPSP